MTQEKAVGGPRSQAGQLHRAELVSGLGAVVLGVGLGLLLSRYLQGAAVPVLLAGVVVHGWGMYDKRRLEQAEVPRAWWVEALYWLCWILLAGVVGATLVAL